MVLKQVKLYFTIALVVFLLLACAQAALFYKKYQKEKASRERLEENQKELLKEKAQYALIKQSIDEFKETISAKVDSVLQAGKIKPKNVERIIERHYFYRDTSYQVHVPDPVTVGDAIIYPFTDIKNCFTIKGFMELRDKKPALTITDREYENVSTDIAYLEREKKFLGIRFGKWKGRLKTINQCGETTTKEIEIVK